VVHPHIFADSIVVVCLYASYLIHVPVPGILGFACCQLIFHLCCLARWRADVLTSGAATSTIGRQMLGRCVGQAGRLEGGVSSGPTPAQAAHLKKDLDATFGGLKAARRARDLKQLKQAVKDVKKSGFAPFGKVALANAEKLVATLGRKQAQDEEGVAETGWWAVDRCGGRRSKAGECGQCAECIERELLVDFEEHAAAQAEWGGARRRGRR